jgi:hypothetical protein
MRILVSYPDGSQRVELDDGQTVILSSPYSNGERKISTTYGKDIGTLSSQYPNGHKVANFSDGSKYDVSVRPRVIGGPQETWDRFNRSHVNDSNPDDHSQKEKPTNLECKQEEELSVEEIEEIRSVFDDQIILFKSKCPVYDALAQYFTEIGDDTKARKVLDNKNSQEKGLCSGIDVNMHGGNIKPWKYLHAINDALRSDRSGYQPPHYLVYNQSRFSSIRGYGENYQSETGKPQWGLDIVLYLCINTNDNIIPFIRVDFSPSDNWENPHSIENPDFNTLLDWLRNTTKSFISKQQPS